MIILREVLEEGVIVSDSVAGSVVMTGVLWLGWYQLVILRVAHWLIK